MIRHVKISIRGTTAKKKKRTKWICWVGSFQNSSNLTRGEENWRIRGRDRRLQYLLEHRGNQLENFLPLSSDSCFNPCWNPLVELAKRSRLIHDESNQEVISTIQLAVESRIVSKVQEVRHCFTAAAWGGSSARLTKYFLSKNVERWVPAENVTWKVCDTEFFDSLSSWSWRSML
jgi:hypothetical protein